MHSTRPISELEKDLATRTSEPASRGINRYKVSPSTWTTYCEQLGNGLDLMGLWADLRDVHLAARICETDEYFIISCRLKEGHYPSVAAHHPPALRAERMMKDLYGHCPDGLPDTRPWLDHGEWPVSHPMAKTPGKPSEPKPYSFLAALGEGLHQIPVGPVHAGIIEPGHFRFHCAGETVVRLEERQGYTHKGIEKLLEGKTPQDAAPLVARISGDSTVAYALTFARACEHALETSIPARALYLRALMAELERLANHFGDIGGICNDAAFAFLQAHFSVLREDVLQACQLCFGHRLMMDCVIPGGVLSDLDASDITKLEALIRGLNERLPKLIEVYDNTPSLENRTRNSGELSRMLAAKFAAGGYIGRAACRDFDVRKNRPYAPYDALSFQRITSERGDVDGRVHVRIFEAEQSLSLCTQLLEKMPEGEIFTPLPERPAEAREGFAISEGFRGDVLIWVKINARGKISRCYPRDPSQFQWPLLEAVIENNIVADFPLCNKSFNCSYSGNDL